MVIGILNRYKVTSIVSVGSQKKPMAILNGETEANLTETIYKGMGRVQGKQQGGWLKHLGLDAPGDKVRELVMEACRGWLCEKGHPKACVALRRKRQPLAPHSMVEMEDEDEIVGWGWGHPASPIQCSLFPCNPLANPNQISGGPVMR